MAVRHCICRHHLAIAALMGCVTGAQAAPPWQHLIPFRKASYTPAAAELEITESTGPWMVLAAVFSGEAARDEATQLVRELRGRHGLAAYLHVEHFDFTDRVQGLGVDRNNRPKRMKYAQADQFDEVAVMVGDFGSWDDPELKETLEKIKKMRPDCLKTQDPGESSLRFAMLRYTQRLAGSDGGRERGPLAKAFITRNPLLPQEYFTPRGIDKMTLGMNKDVKFSLLNCPGKYSVRVATFSGKVIIDQRKLMAIETNKAAMESKLEEAAINAHKLTVALRKRGIEAYEFHDRHESIVTVGNFESVGTRQPNGQIELMPDVYRVINKFAARRREFAGRTGAAMEGLEPHQLEGIPFDVQPLPVEVPRRSIATDYANDSRRR